MTTKKEKYSKYLREELTIKQESLSHTGSNLIVHTAPYEFIRKTNATYILVTRL